MSAESVQLERLCVSEAEAAEMVGLSLGTYRQQVRVGSLPPPLAFGRRKVVYVRALREALDKMAGLGAPSGGEDNEWLA